MHFIIITRRAEYETTNWFWLEKTIKFPSFDDVTVTRRAFSTLLSQCARTYISARSSPCMP